MYNMTETFNHLFCEVEKSDLLKKDIAHLAGIHENTLRNFLNHHKGDVKTLFKLADVLGYEIIMIPKEE